MIWLLLLLAWLALGYAPAAAVFLPFHMLASSLVALLSAPGTILRLASNALLRKNHGLEHATINILEQELGDIRSAGMATEEGFFIKAQGVSAQDVAHAASLGRARLLEGNSRLAIHPRCGTSRAAANVIMSALFVVLLILGHLLSPAGILAALLLGHLTGPVFGTFLQKHFTTSARVERVFIVGVEALRSRGFLGLVFRPNTFFVRTVWH
ncbi:MAG: DUF6391 domain-containing protein [Bacillota bacterium]